MSEHDLMKYCWSASIVIFLVIIGFGLIYEPVALLIGFGVGSFLLVMTILFKKILDKLEGH